MWVRSYYLCRKILLWRERQAGPRPRLASYGKWWAEKLLPPSPDKRLVQLLPAHPSSSSGADSKAGRPQSLRRLFGEERFPQLAPVWSCKWGSAAHAQPLDYPPPPSILKSPHSRNTGLHPYGLKRKSLPWPSLQKSRAHLRASSEKSEASPLLLASEASRGDAAKFSCHPSSCSMWGFLSVFVLCLSCLLRSIVERTLKVSAGQQLK